MRTKDFSEPPARIGVSDLTKAIEARDKIANFTVPASAIQNGPASAIAPTGEQVRTKPDIAQIVTKTDRVIALLQCELGR